jgi:hypothetical protein
MASGFTETGFERDNLSQIILDIENDVKVAFKNPKFSIEDNENMGQFLKVFAGRENNFWQALEQCYNIWRLNGCEGAFLDEILALQGVFRESATSGSGDAVVETDSDATDTTSVGIGTIFLGENSGQYAATSTTLVSERVTAFKVNGATASLATYNMDVEVLTTGDSYSSSFTLSSTTPSARLTFLNSIKSFLETVDPTQTVYIDNTNLILYWGFDEAYELTGINNTVQMLCTPSLGNRYSLVECVNTATGFNPLGVGEISTMSVLPTGYVSVTNLSAFSAGTDVESDAAFIERARDVSDSPASATRTAIIAGLLANVSGIEKVKLVKEISGGIVTVSPIIIGGTIADVAQELYRTQPINNQYSGDITYSVTTEDDEIETIQFSRGVEQELSIRITYSTTTDVDLTLSERSTMKNNLLDVSESWQLGKKIFNFSLMSAVSSAQDSSEFSTLLVEVKKLEDPISSYSSNDYSPAATELPQLQSDNITFVRVV